MNDEEFETKLVSYLKDNLWIDVVSDEVYTGNTNGNMYKQSHTLRVYLNQDVITEAYLD